MRNIHLLVASLGLLIAASLIQSCQSTKSSTASKMMKFNFENGKGYDYDMRMEMNTAIGPIGTKMGVNAYYSMTVTGDDSSGKSIAVVYDRMGMEMDFLSKHIEFGSDAEETDLGGLGGEKGAEVMQKMNKVFRAMRGKQFNLKVSPEGKIIEMNGLEELMQMMVDSISGGDDSKNELREAFSKQFNPDEIKEQFEQAFFFFPNKMVKVGDTWDKDMQTHGIMKSNLHTTYKVKEIEGDMVTLSLKGKIEMTGENGNAEGEQEGTMVVDSRSGLIVNSDVDQTITSSASQFSLTVTINSKIRGKAR